MAKEPSVVVIEATAKIPAMNHVGAMPFLKGNPEALWLSYPLRIKRTKQLK